MLLCDWAEEINGKLYIMGGGWSRLTLVQPATMALAVKVLVPWNEANRRHNIETTLVDEDGKLVELAPPGATEETPRQSLRLPGELEVGRPPGLQPGSPLDAALVMRFHGLVLKEGRYNWIFKIDGNEEGRVSFDVMTPTQGGGGA